MAHGPIISRPIVREKVEAETDFLYLGSKITVDGDCSHETRRYLLLGRKAMTNFEDVLKIRDISLLTKVCIVKAMIFLVVVCGCESWMVNAIMKLKDTFSLEEKL